MSEVTAGEMAGFLVGKCICPPVTSDECFERATCHSCVMANMTPVEIRAKYAELEGGGE